MKIAIVSAIFGNMDERSPIPEQTIPVEQFFFNESNSNPPGDNDRTKAFYFKLQIHKTSDADVYIWIDGKIQVLSKDFVAQILRQLGTSDLAILRHHERNCIYREVNHIEHCINKGNDYLKSRYGPDSGRPIRKEVEHYRSLGYPPNRGLNDCKIFAVRNTKAMRELFDEWWAVCLQGAVDQLAIQFLTWKRKIRIMPLVFKPGSFNDIPHKKMKSKIIVAVVVHDRIENISQWFTIWKVCNKEDAELVIIHNYYNNEAEKKKFQSSCETFGIRYVPRNEKGFDLGAFQDVCYQRLEGFPNNWEYLLWCTDDTIPMTKDFIAPFVEGINNYVGLTCMQISEELTRHVRTTGFCITKDISLKLMFPIDPITTVQDCYHFEHSGGDQTLLYQILSMGLVPIQVAPLAKSPLYDKGYWSRNQQAIKQRHLFDRSQELSDFIRSIQQKSSISIVIPCYEMKGKGAAMLKELLDSISGQQIDHEFEVVVSDCSKDNSIKSVCDGFLGLPISYHRNDKTYGAPENINNVLELAKYDFIKLMCQDDKFSHLHAINLFVEALQKGGWAISNSVYMNERGRLYSKCLAHYRHGNFEKNTVGMPSVVAWRKCDIRFDGRIRTVCDMKFYYDLYELYGMPEVIQEFVVAQRFHGASMSHNQPRKHNEDVEFLRRNKLIAI